MLVTATAWIQTAAQSFEVASVKPNTSAEAVGRMVVSPGLFRATAVNIRALTAIAFTGERRLLNFQIVDGPGWMATDRFDIIARGDTAVRDLRTVAPLLRQLLADRFQLRSHREERPQTIYALTRRPGAELQGPALKRPTIDCNVPAVRAANPSVPANGRPGCGGRFDDGTIEAGGYSLASLANGLASTLQHVVIDDTGLTGTFDIKLEWRPDTAAADDRPSLFTAVEEQLGLKLEPRTANVEVIVIDEIRHPTPD